MLNNLLIVDDEYYTVEIIKNQYRWEELGIGQVFIAYSVTQAMSLVETQHIDVAICDIEMGSQNGLDLLAWLQKTIPMWSASSLPATRSLNIEKGTPFVILSGAKRSNRRQKS